MTTQRCPFCGADADQAPRQDAIGFCVECGEFAVSDGLGGLRKPTDDEYITIGSNPVLRAARDMWVKAIKERKRKPSPHHVNAGVQASKKLARKIGQAVDDEEPAALITALSEVLAAALVAHYPENYGEVLRNFHDVTRALSDIFKSKRDEFEAARKGRRS